jgi:hypothetical protein
MFVLIMRLQDFFVNHFEANAVSFARGFKRHQNETGSYRNVPLLKLCSGLSVLFLRHNTVMAAQ